MLEASSVGVLETGGQRRVTAIAPSGCDQAARRAADLVRQV
jgi:hypothetical protein